VAAYFFDSSAVVKRYVEEVGTSWVLGILNPDQKNHIYLARITGAEVVAALARKRRTGELPEADLSKTIQQFRRDWKAIYRIVEVTSHIIDRAMTLAEEESLRGYDAVQLAVALEVKSLTQQKSGSGIYFVSADPALNDIATKKGMQVKNPQSK
jgi:hypothetical protein